MSKRIALLTILYVGWLIFVYNYWRLATLTALDGVLCLCEQLHDWLK